MNRNLLKLSADEHEIKLSGLRHKQDTITLVYIKALLRSNNERIVLVFIKATGTA